MTEAITLIMMILGFAVGLGLGYPLINKILDTSEKTPANKDAQRSRS